jgi:hypothetical protein
MTTVQPNQSQVQIALRSFLLGLNLPFTSTTSSTAAEVIQGQDNRVPEPSSPDFVIMTPIRRQRLSTNVDSDVDSSFTGSIAGTVMNVSFLNFGEVTVGATVYGAAPGTYVASLGSGTGGIGTYNVSVAQTLAPGQLYAGQHVAMQPTEVVVQLDVHGPFAADNAQIIATMLRDPSTFDTFSASGYDVMALYADDPRQTPFENAESQYEFRWTVDAHLQANQVVGGIGQQFFASLVVNLQEVEQLG